MSLLENLSQNAISVLPDDTFRTRGTQRREHRRLPVETWLDRETSAGRARYEFTQQKPSSGLNYSLAQVTAKHTHESEPTILASYDTKAAVNGRSDWHMRLAQGMPLTNPLSTQQVHGQQSRQRGHIFAAMNTPAGYSVTENTINHVNDSPSDEATNAKSTRPKFNISSIQKGFPTALQNGSDASGSMREILDRATYKNRGIRKSVNNNDDIDSLLTALKTERNQWERRRQRYDAGYHALNGEAGRVPSKTWDSLDTERSFTDAVQSFADDVKQYASTILSWAGLADEPSTPTDPDDVAHGWNHGAQSAETTNADLFAHRIADYHDAPRLIRNEKDLDGDELRTPENVRYALRNDGLEQDTATTWTPSEAYKTTVNERSLSDDEQRIVDHKAKTLDRIRELRIAGENPTDHLHVSKRSIERDYDTILQDEYLARNAGKDLWGAALTAYNDKVENRREAQRLHDAGHAPDDIADELSVTAETVKESYLS